MPDEPLPALEPTGPELPRTTGRPPGTGGKVGEYELLSEVARGGMGVVYRARHARLGRLVALKMILTGPRATAADLRRFREEAEAAAGLDHPGIVPVYDFGEHHGRPYFTMAFVEGHSLASRLTRGPLENAVAAGVVRAAAVAVQYAHEHGVIHRDLKPGNVLLEKDGTVKVTDFGLARRIRPEETQPDLEDDAGAGPPSPLAEDEPAQPEVFDTALGEISTTPPAPTEEDLHRLTRTGALMGTPSYMAPEQVADAKRVGPAADVWALGAMLYALLTGRPPFLGSCLVDTLRQVVETDPAPPRSLNPAIDPDLETVCLKCLCKDPAARYASAAELADELGRYQAGQPLRARPSDLLERTLRWVHANPAVPPFVAGLVTWRLIGLAEGLFVAAALAALRLPYRLPSAEAALTLGVTGVLTAAGMTVSAEVWNQPYASSHLLTSCVCGAALGLLAAFGWAALSSPPGQAARSGRAFAIGLAVLALEIAIPLPLLDGLRDWLRANPASDVPAVGGTLVFLMRAGVWVVSLGIGVAVLFVMVKVAQKFNVAFEDRTALRVFLPGCLMAVPMVIFILWFFRTVIAMNDAIVQNWNSAAVANKFGVVASWGRVIGILSGAMAAALSWLAAVLLGISAGGLLGRFRDRFAPRRLGDVRSAATSFTLGAAVAAALAPIGIWLLAPSADLEYPEYPVPRWDAGAALVAAFIPDWESPMRWPAVSLARVLLLGTPAAVGGLFFAWLIAGAWRRKSSHVNKDPRP
jgi:serine/threonine protein kinase